MAMTAQTEELMKMRNLRSRDIQGRKAILTEDVAFFTSVSRNDNSLVVFEKGTEVTGVYRMTNTDLYIFRFNGLYNFPIRSYKFEWKDEREDDNLYNGGKDFTYCTECNEVLNSEDDLYPDMCNECGTEKSYNFKKPMKFSNDNDEFHEITNYEPVGYSTDND